MGRVTSSAGARPTSAKTSERPRDSAGVFTRKKNMSRRSRPSSRMRPCATVSSSTGSSRIFAATVGPSSERAASTAFK
jgi:hypothetical protein